MNIRRISVLAAMGGIALSLIGAGVGASFMDSATATTNIKVGTFAISISSSTMGAMVSGKTVTLTCPDILSSQPGTCPLQFTITDTGTIPAMVSVSATSLSSPFSDLLASGPAVPVAAGGHQDYSGGIGWSMLSNANLGQAVSITYTVSATG